jgi:SpoVK/Ycf46/Vps4 family AAA+-type ATPase
LLDEVDSFLQDRRSTAHHWEVSLVNEMLTQMEAFDGVFIASTNLMRDLDQAALRRFDLKVRFDFLSAEQAWMLLGRHCAEMQMPPTVAELKTRLDALHNLTPGDYAAVSRQHRFKALRDPAAFISALELEASLKEVTGRSIGFVH